MYCSKKEAKGRDIKTSGRDTTEVVLATTFGREEEASKTKEKRQRRQIYSNSENSDNQIKKGGGL